MDVECLIYELNRLYDDYGVDKTQLSLLTQDQITKMVKGLLATLDANKNQNYTSKDLEILKDIFFYYG
jgi:hypothetical protein